MKNLRSYSEFLTEGISPEITANDIFKYIDGPARKQLEGAGRLLDVSILRMQDPVNPGKSGEYIYFFRHNYSNSISLYRIQ